MVVGVGETRELENHRRLGPSRHIAPKVPSWHSIVVSARFPRLVLSRVGLLLLSRSFVGLWRISIKSEVINSPTG